MAKTRKLSGAALASYNRARARTAIVPVSAAPIVVRAPARRSKPTRRRKARAYAAPRRAGIGGIVNMAAQKLPALAGSAAYGWLTKAPDAKELADYAAAKAAGKDYSGGSIQLKVYGLPFIDAIGRKATQGLALAAVAAFTGGVISRVAGHLSNAALHAWAFDLGRNDASFENAAKVQGVESAAYVGALDDLDDDFTSDE